MDKRRANSFGKGLRTSTSQATRLVRTSSWNAGLSSREDRSNLEIPGPILVTAAAVHKTLDESNSIQRHRRPSMRRMVRFRMSSTEIDLRRFSAGCSPPEGGAAVGAVAPVAEMAAMAPAASTAARSETGEGNAGSVTLANNESREGDERSTPSVSVPTLEANEGETPAVFPVAAFSLGCNSVEGGSVPGHSDRSWSNTRPIIQQVSRFSVMQTNLEDPLQSINSVDSVLSHDANNNGRTQRRQRGRRHRDNRQQRSRSRRHRSTNCSPAIRDSTADDDSPIVRTSRRRRHADTNVDPEEESRRNRNGIWPHSMSSVLALSAATLGLFNISRFAFLSIEYGGNFIVQFVMLSFLFGIPILCFHGCLGQFLGSGIIDMWKISPIFKGVGISILIAQAIEGIYTMVGIAWMFFYFRDSFIAQEDTYKWTRCPEPARKCASPTNYTFSLEDTIPDYFHARVLQRTTVTSPPLNFVSLKFEIAFNLAVIWMIVFVALGKGLRSYGKAVYAFGTLPLLGFFVVCVKILGVSSSVPNSISGLLEHTPWREFFTDTRVWVIAAREVFLTWGLCGAIIMQITSHNRYHHSLRRDVAIVILITFLVLLLSAFVASAAIQIINQYGFDYISSSSFETDKGYKFLKNWSKTYRSRLRSRFSHNNFLMGVAVRPAYDEVSYDRSGYQPLRLATELIPTVVAVMQPMAFSPFWAVLFYFSLVGFGIAHQLAIWHCVISGIVAFRACCLKSWETTITFFTCALGFLFSLPMATELGISIVYLLDYVVGSAWWLMIIYVIQIAAVLIVRGRPYSGESIVAVLIKGTGCMANWCNPLLSFSWSVVLPIGLVVLSIASFKTGNYRDIFTGNTGEGYKYWPIWARQSGTIAQLALLLLIPVAGVIQSIRYLTQGPPDLFERIKLLYRPHFRTYIIRPEESQTRRSRGNLTNGQPRTGRSQSRSPSPGPPSFVDPPPKYTPPPTYNTATGARIAKLLRESIRRSIRQIRDFATPVQTPAGTVNSMAALAVLEMGSRSRDQEATTLPSHLPPAYTSVVMEMQEASDASTSSDGISERLSQITGCDSTEPTTSDSSSHATITAAEVTRLLRESFRRSARNTMLMFRNRKLLSSETTIATATTSVHTDDDVDASDADDGLVIRAAPIHRDPAQTSVVVTLPNADANTESVA